MAASHLLARMLEQAKAKADRRPSSDGSPRSFQWGVRLLPGTGQPDAAATDADLAEVAVPVEAFDVFCLAQCPGKPHPYICESPYGNVIFL